jgi:formylglycine-generating enzyme required for sulfatase activity/serine/threonine protein kinase
MPNEVPEKVAQAALQASKLFAEFVAQQNSAPSVDFDAFCRAHPAAERELRLLEAHWERVLGVLQHLGVPNSRTTAVSAPALDPTAHSVEVLHRLAGRKNAASRYSVKGEVARGGMGAILRVWDEDLRRNLAMKVVLSQADAKTPGGTRELDSLMLDRFLEEAQVTSQLEHPGIVPVHELGLDPDGRVFFTMRLISGRDLGQIFALMRSESEGWTQTRVVGVVLKICEAMSYAHDKGVIHRDLKPANVMVGKFGEVYVMDWGLARVLGKEDQKEGRSKSKDSSTFGVSTDRLDSRHSGRSSPMNTMDGDVVGTPAYMSPEQARGDLAAMGPMSDVYSTGAILYHLLAGHMPYAPTGTEPSTIEVWEKARSQSPEPLHERAPQAPAELIAICEKAMARKLQDRYAGMVELAEDLRAYLEGRVVHAYETGAVAEFRKWVVRNKGLAVTTLVALSVILAGTTTASVVLSNKNKALGIANNASQASELKALENEKLAKHSAAIAEERASRILRLSDLKRHQELMKQADLLWPAHPEKIPALEAWLAQAQDLITRLPQHRAALDQLREAGVAAQAGVGSAGNAWSFAKPEDAWLHDLQAELVSDLETFSDPNRGRIADVTKRLEFARTVEPLTVSGEEASALWNKAIGSIADVAVAPRYGGLKLRPQIGLLPLGQDRASGLWEFAHLQTGVPAIRNPDTGTLELTEQSGIVFVLIPGGTFEMGAQRDEPDEVNFDPAAESDEGPVHSITLAPFFISKYEMTQGQWLRIAGNNPSIYAAGRIVGGVPTTLLNPVEQVSWGDCTELLLTLALQLPTEAQWEYAARAGTTTPWWTGKERNSLEGACNIADRAAKRGSAKWPGIDDWPELDDGFTAHAPVDQFLPNPFGLHNVHGNVWEWCRDEYGEYSLEVSPGDGERLGGNPTFHVSRGGSFLHPASHSRSANRNNSAPDTRANHLGLRPERALVQ